MVALPHEPRAALLPPNPVWRSYLGGSTLRHFRAAAGTNDDHFPEDWLASTVRARNGVHAQHEFEGISRLRLDGREASLPELLQQQPSYWFGPESGNMPNGSTGVLWKLLDSSVRLQVQAHPDATFAGRHLNSAAGKTECWYILSTRGRAHVYLGFQRPPIREEWRRMIEEQRVEEMLACFDPIEVRAGECYVVPAGTPHAIGAGVFMMELQEPTDWVVRCETVNAGLRLPPEACFMGLTLERCLHVFDYRAMSVAEVRSRFQQTPRQVTRNERYSEEEVIGSDYHRFFRLHRLRGSGAASWAGNELMLLVVLAGEGALGLGDACDKAQAGQTWLLPAAASQWEWAGAGDRWELLLAKLPRTRRT